MDTHSVLFSASWDATATSRAAEELAFHFQAHVEACNGKGRAPAEARGERASSSATPRSSGEVRDSDRVWFEQLRQDLGYGLRLLRRDPGLSCGIVAILAVALGMTTAVWSFADKSLLRPLPFEDAGRLAWLRGSDTQRGFERMPISYQDFLDWRERTRSFEDLAAWRNESRIRSDGAFPERVRVAAGTDNLHGLLGTTPLLGGLPRSDTDAVLSHAYWNGRFGSDPDVVGARLRLDGRNLTIVGVLPARFAFPPFPPEYRPQVWVSLDHGIDPAARIDRGARSLWAVGRLARGADLDAAGIEMDAIALDLERAYPETNRTAGASMGPLGELWGDRLQRDLPIVVLGAALALLVACSNVVGLLIGHAMRRRREFAVRSALGAGALRLARQLAAEVGLLFAAGTGAGLLLAHAALPPLVRQFSQGGSYLSAVPQVSPRVQRMAAVAIAAGLLTTLGLLAGVRPGRGSLSPATRLGNAPRRSGLRRGVLVVQIGVSMVVIFASALLTASFRSAATEPVGFDMTNLLALRIETPMEMRGESERMESLLRQIGERADLVAPGSSAALAYSGPFGSLGASRFFEVSRQPVPETTQPPLAGYRLVSRNYFDLLGIPVLRGRGLPARTGGVLPVVVNQAFVDRHLDSVNPVGAGLRFFSELQQRLDRSRAIEAEIVGVVADEKFWRLDAELLPQAYASIESQPPNGFDLLIRTSDPDGARDRLRTELSPLLPGVPIDRLRRIEDSARATVRGRWLGVAVMNLLSVLALALALVGVYAVLSSSVHERRQELAIRAALGARQSGLVRMVVRGGLLLAAAGVALGVGGSLAPGFGITLEFARPLALRRGASCSSGPRRVLPAARRGARSAAAVLRRASALPADAPPCATFLDLASRISASRR